MILARTMRAEVDRRFMLSSGTAFGDDEIGMTRSNPHSGQLFEPAHFVLVSPDNQVFSRGVRREWIHPCVIQ